MKRLEGKIVAAVKSKGSNAGQIVGQSLRNLREMVGITQQEMAALLDVGQAAISKIERRGDVQISSLQRYVEALGATLRIEASFPASELDIYKTDSSDLFEEEQLVLPLLDEGFSKSTRDLILSIRPQYSEKIMEGKKTVELRRRFPQIVPCGTIAYIYSTSPVRALVGYAVISRINKLPLKNIWAQYSKSAFITKKDFDSYFAGLESGFALEFSDVRPLPRALELAELRDRFGFEPPQSFLYAKPDLLMALKHEFSKVSH